jgi:2-C-methyl-D-erythritol 2,4-cyclodiphosphate synthase
MMRIGHGFDVHAFTQGNHVILGGVKIAHSQALLAHSDGDVLIHAICDALLGALALGDIGQHFPDTSAQFKAIDSRILLRKVNQLLQSYEYQLANLDCTLVAQTPKMSPHIVQMRKNIASDLHCDTNQVSVKATTTEKLGFTGRKEGIAAHAVVLLIKGQDV